MQRQSLRLKILTPLVLPRRLKREERLLPISKLTPLLADTDMADNATESSLVASRGLMSFFTAS